MSNPNSTALCIGGVADGRRVTDYGDPYMKVCSDTPVASYNQRPQDPIYLVRKDSVYRRERIMANGEEFAVYVETNLKTSTALSLLIGRYPNNLKP